VNTRQANDIVRRVVAWANQGDDEDLERSGAARSSRWAI
jgi:hypothetical protein